ncbi:MAG: glycosyltransferase, partial [Flavobacteriaceae bacterium]|nr:glycosyltransferase [Flavobacteriaceae bacterium]
MSNSPTPLVSFILLAYNQENLITEAVESLLSQTYSPLEIILSDDCSSDSTFTIMKSLKDSYKGPHKIKLNRNKTNLGISAHINKLVALTHGDLIFCAAGDDISLPKRCSEVVSFWLDHNKQPDLIATDAYDMTFNGEVLGLKKTSP